MCQQPAVDRGIYDHDDLPSRSGVEQSVGYPFWDQEPADCTWRERTPAARKLTCFYLQSVD